MELLFMFGHPQCTSVTGADASATNFALGVNEPRVLIHPIPAVLIMCTSLYRRAICASSTPALLGFW